MKNNILESKKCKVVFFGENNVGKTNIITRYVKNFTMKNTKVQITV